jgi:hypothetical protein
MWSGCVRDHNEVVGPIELVTDRPARERVAIADEDAGRTLASWPEAAVQARWAVRCVLSAFVSV